MWLTLGRNIGRNFWFHPESLPKRFAGIVAHGYSISQDSIETAKAVRKAGIFGA